MDNNASIRVYHHARRARTFRSIIFTTCRVGGGRESTYLCDAHVHNVMGRVVHTATYVTYVSCRHVATAAVNASRDMACPRASTSSRARTIQTIPSTLGYPIARTLYVSRTKRDLYPRRCSLQPYEL